MKKYMYVCPICGNTYETDQEHQYVCKSCLSKSQKHHVKRGLCILQDLGWSDLIDPRWAEDVKEILLKYKVPLIDVYAILSLVLY